MVANVIVLLFNGLTLTLALGLVILVLWQDPSNEANRYFALFLLMVVMWSSGSLLARAAAYVSQDESTIQIGLRLLEIGFTGSTISVYIYSAVITGVRGRLFRLAALAGLGIVFVYQFLLLLVLNTPRHYSTTASGSLIYNFEPSSVFLYLVFQLSTVVLVWRNRLKIRTRTLTAGILLFSTGQILGMFTPRFRVLGVSEDLAAWASLMMSYSVVRQQIMLPLLGRAKQLEAVRDVGLAVTSRLHLQETLSAIAAQAAGLLGADGAAIFLEREPILELAAVYNLPQQFVGIQIPVGHGVVGTVASERRGRRVENYRSDWKGEDDLPLARETFGAVICVPLMFANEVVGVLLVVHGRQGRLFNRDDMYLLELLGPQAAVAITNSRLFEAERKLSGDLSAAKGQLEAVLTSTENPVVAVDRRLRIIFANPAALKLMDLPLVPVGQPVNSFVPRNFLPLDLRRALRDLHNRNLHVYELTAQGRIYLCHVAELGKPRPEGWVVVLNDVTQLKELDRLKSQMIQMTSHDLKNPLQAAMSYLELLEEDGETILTGDMQEYVSVVWDQLSRMYRIINGILSMERVQSGVRAFEECSLEDLLGRVVVDFAAPARNAGITLELDIKERLPSVLGDPQQLSQAFANLVENAVKFTAAGGRVMVKAEVHKHQVWIDVIDTGVGISADELPRVFERFYRGRHPGQAQVSGSGLGLSLVKTILDAHRGEIELESEPGCGTTVHVRLPAMSGGTGQE